MKQDSFRRDDLQKKTPFQQCSIETQKELAKVAKSKPGTLVSISVGTYGAVDGNWIMVPTKLGEVQVVTKLDDSTGTYKAFRL